MVISINLDALFSISVMIEVTVKLDQLSPISFMIVRNGVHLMSISFQIFIVLLFFLVLESCRWPTRNISVLARKRPVYNICVERVWASRTCTQPHTPLPLEQRPVILKFPRGNSHVKATYYTIGII